MSRYREAAAYTVACIVVTAAVLAVCEAQAESRYVLPFFAGAADRLYVTSAQDGATVEVCGAAGCAERAASPPDAVRPAAADLDGVVEAGRQRVTVTSDDKVEVVAVRRGPPLLLLPVVTAAPAAPRAPEAILIETEAPTITSGDIEWTLPPLDSARCSSIHRADVDRRTAVYLIAAEAVTLRAAVGCHAPASRSHVPRGARRYEVWWRHTDGALLSAGDAQLLLR